MALPLASILANPLFLVGTTLGAFQLGQLLYERSGKLPVLQPVLVAIACMVVFLLISDVPYETYHEGTRMLHLLLGPAIVALAVPLAENLRKARSALGPVLVTLALGGAGVTLSALLIGRLAGLDGAMLLSLATKTVSAPIALGVAEAIGGDASLTILSVFTTGIFGVIATPTILRLLRVEDEAVRGFTLGLTSHAFGIARSLEISSQAAAFATLGMGLMGCATAIAVPVLYALAT
ncbi:LrgB family protein [Salinarimonas sp.]|uniref:LrgB family protein n=1 Tax=Salinarimonas sp. TaxID=2766526 RepID=UPI0032D8C7EE